MKKQQATVYENSIQYFPGPKKSNIGIFKIAQTHLIKKIQNMRYKFSALHFAHLSLIILIKIVLMK